VRFAGQHPVIVGRAIDFSPDGEKFMADDTARRTTTLIERLREKGHDAEADRLSRHLTLRDAGHGLLFALREALETILTAIEAIDPVTETMIEELRVEVEKRLQPPKEQGLAPAPGDPI
jgi:hypothetical protein